ncbi:MAB_1171c family putative transporter [Arthrobacter sp. YD2]|uniref:MAB_1171c family putative transporter n=1 Tax=Arthrobacter sp. YD2 TaxID=3058046 RepID=UPI0025B570EE|nr:MAB_1171c family putative transporter [Arthrobacter sp. YD2]MDN3903290.1 hypothetical protein [Arthrobacter sp. YD2]
MSTIVVAVFMWLLVLTLLLRARSRPDNTMVKAAVVIAASLTTNINGVYLWASDGLPWPNALDLVSNILLIIGVYYLSRAIVRGAGAGDGSVDRAQRWSAVAAAGTVLVMVVAFCLIDDPRASTTFMLDFGDQPAAGIYSGVQYLYIFAVMARTLSTCIRNVPQMRRRRFRVGFRLIGAGCGVGLVLCTSVIVMDIAHVAGAESLMRAVGTVYDISYALTVVLLATGLAVPPLGRVLNDINVRREVRELEPQVKAIWLSTVALAPAVSLLGTTARSLESDREHTTRDATDAIHRRVIEIHDWLNVSGSTAPELSAEHQSVLERAEALCLKQGRSVR